VDQGLVSTLLRGQESEQRVAHEILAVAGSTNPPPP
jgi:hypothetical protein